MADTKAIQVDISKVRAAVQSSMPLTITTYTLPHEMEEYMANVLNAFLKEAGQTQMIEPLSYCMRELVNNAKKANTKRVYFEEHNLDINNVQDYENGMKSFKQDTISNIQYYLQLQKNKGLYVKLTLQASNGRIKIEIKNNAELTVFEYYRIHDKINRAQQFDSVEEGLTQILDDSEGAGLGLVIMILVLRKIGLTDENYQVISEKGETITRLILPFSKKSTNDIKTLSSGFVEFIDGLPQFPENITEISRAINDPDSTMSDIALRISNDVALTGELLKLVNSAAYYLSSPCTSIPDAVKFLGLRGVRNLLFSLGATQSLMGVNTKEKKELWEHSNRVASFAFSIARNYCKAPTERLYIEDSYVCGLLHDMGKIIFEAARPDILQKINKMCTARGVSKGMFEQMVAGMNHGEIGALIAEKWNFPQIIATTIRYHHTPLAAPSDMRLLVSIVYLADLIDHYIDGSVYFEQFDPDVLARFNIVNEEQLNALSKRL